MKTIGVVVRELKKDDISFLGQRKDLFDAFQSFSVNVIAIPITENFDKLKNIVLMCDGIVLSGGSGFIPNDFLLIDFLYQNNIPTLGICLGMQLMAEHFNNYVEKNINNHNSKEKYVHSIVIKEDSLLYEIIGKKVIKVNSRHNYCVPYTSLDVSAISEDGIIEAVEDKSKTFFLGVQWHPESIIDENSLALLKYFVDKL